MRFIAFIYIILFASYLYSQNLYFPVYHYESENGLIHLNVLTVQQDKYNVLNVVTNGGVYEYSGKMFTKKNVYAALKNTRNVYFNDTAEFLIQRDKGLFYVRKNKVYSFFNQNPFKRPSDKILLNGNFAYNLTEQISVEIYDNKNKIYYSDSLLIKDQYNQAFCISECNNKILVGRKKGLYVMNGNVAEAVKYFSKIPVFSMFHHKQKKQMYFGSSNKIIITDDSVFKIQKEISVRINDVMKSAQFLVKLDKNISKIVVDKYDRVWFTVQPDDNLYLYENNQVYGALDILNIPPTLINDIYLDSFNNIWISTFNDGLYQIVSDYWKSMKIMMFQKTLNIKSLAIDNGKIFTATNNGLYYLDTNFSKMQITIPPDNFFNNEIHCIQKYNSKIFCTNITAFDLKNFYFENTQLVILPFKFLAFKNNITCFVSDITNNVLLYDLKKNKVIDTLFKPTDYRLNVKFLHYVNNELFIASNKGLFVYNEQNKKITAYLQDNEINKITVLNNNVLVLYENKIYNYTQKNILLDAEKYNIANLNDIESWDKYYFISSEEGLLLLDSDFKYINFFSRKNGLISNIINDILVFNDNILIATDKGISYSQIHNLLSYQFSINSPIVTHITTNTDSVFLNKKIPIKFDNNTQDIYFHIVCPNYNPLNKVTFQYSLNQSGWVNFENSPLHFSTLAGGNYSLKIRATTDNIHFTEPFVIQFDKEFKVYEKSWFWEMVIAIGISVILASVWIIRKIEEKKSAEKLKNIQQMNLLKHQAMNAILSPHFIFNSLTGIQNYILMNDAEKASEYLSKFSRLIRMIIDKASLPDISLQDEIKRLQFYLELEKERFHDKFDFEIKVDENLDLEHTHIPNMIIQPYLENAILHGILPKKEKGKITLSINLKESNFLEIIIEDDGIGIIKGEEKKPKHHKSLATQTISEILSINTQLYKKHQSVQIIDKNTIDATQTGTIVKITIEL